MGKLALQRVSTKSFVVLIIGNSKSTDEEVGESAALAFRWLAALTGGLELAIVTEHFDESLLLLGRRMGWPVQDLVYLSQVRLRKKINRSHTHTHTHRENNTPDTDTHAHDKNNTPTPQTNTSLPQTLNRFVYQFYFRFFNLSLELAIVTEHFDESLLLLGRRMGWPVQDLVYLSQIRSEQEFPF